MTGSHVDGSAWWEPSAEPEHVPGHADWYYSTTGVSNGPVRIEDLRRLVMAGDLRPDHHVRHAGWDTWWSVADSASIIGVQLRGSGPWSSGSIETPEPNSAHEPAESPNDHVLTLIVGETATFGQRLSSWLVDSVVLLFTLMVANNVLAAGPAWSTLVVVAAYVGYTFGLRYLGHDTLGHLMVGLRVRDAATGEPPSWLALAARSSVVVLLALPLLTGILGSMIGTLAHPRSIAWHDLASGTVVVRVQGQRP